VSTPAPLIAGAARAGGAAPWRQLSVIVSSRQGLPMSGRVRLVPHRRHRLSLWAPASFSLSDHLASQRFVVRLEVCLASSLLRYQVSVTWRGTDMLMRKSRGPNFHAGLKAGSDRVTGAFLSPRSGIRTRRSLSACRPCLGAPRAVSATVVDCRSVGRQGQQSAGLTHVVPPPGCPCSAGVTPCGTPVRGAHVCSTQRYRYRELRSDF